METCFPVLSVTLPSNFRVQRGESASMAHNIRMLAGSIGRGA